MRPFQPLMAFALTTAACFSLAAVPSALAQEQPGPGAVAVQPPMAPIPAAPLPPPVQVVPQPMPYVPLPASPVYAVPSVPTALPSAAVLLMPQDQVLASKGTWERQGDQLVLRHQASSGRRSGMIAAGITLLSLAYTPALITGSLFTLFEGPNDVGSSLLIPVAGPFLSGLFALSGQNELGLSGRGAQSWAWSWMLVDGAVQVTGLALLIAGGRARPSATPSFLERVQILPYSNQNGGGVTVSGKF